MPDSRSRARRARARAFGRDAAATARRTCGCSCRCAGSSSRPRVAFGPEDDDGYRDDDFCRDPDNDGDGLDDDADACPNDAEDRDGFEDGDGCPDADNDADGLPDAVDAAPTAAKIATASRTTTAAPSPTTTTTASPTRATPARWIPRTSDGFEDDDGCPEPGPKPVVVSVAESRILVSERIYFDYDRDTIRAVSMPVLDEVAAVIRGLRRSSRSSSKATPTTPATPRTTSTSRTAARAPWSSTCSRAVSPDERLDYSGYGATQPSARTTAPKAARSTAASSSCWCARLCVLCKRGRGGNSLDAAVEGMRMRMRTWLRIAPVQLFLGLACKLCELRAGIAR